jgi:hypothetical protein
MPRRIAAVAGMRVALIRSMVDLPRIPSAVRAVLAVAAWCASTGLASAQAPPCASPAPAPCVIASTINVPSDTIWDLGPREFVIAASKAINVQTVGTLSIHAANITLETGAKILAPGTGGFGGEVTLTATGSIELKSASRIDVSASDGGGNIFLSADGGSLVMQGQLLANAGGGESFGGNVSVFGETGATIGGLGIDASAGGNGAGGLVDASSSRAVLVAGPLIASGGDSDGGEIDLDGGTSVTTYVAGPIDVQATTASGYGGIVNITAGADITLNGAIDGTGHSGRDDDGAGADVEIFSDTGNVDLNGMLDIRGSGTFGEGGSLAVDASGSITVAQPVQASSKVNGTGFGGDVELNAGAELSIIATIDIRGGYGGGGLVGTAGNVASMTGSVLASGTTTPPQAEGPSGGIVLIQACTIDLDVDAEIVNLGTGDPFRGVNRLQASSGMTIAGTLTAGNQNALDWRDVQPTLLPTRTIMPGPVQTQRPDLPCCPGSCSTTTSSTVMTTTTSTVSTSTTTVTSTTLETSTTVASSTTTTEPTTTTTTAATSSTTTTTVASTTTTTVDTSTTTTLAATTTTSTSTTRPPTTSTTSTTVRTACINQPLVGFDAIDCRLGLLADALGAETPGTLGGKRLAKRMTHAFDKARTAVSAAHAGKKVKPNLRRATTQLRTFTKVLATAVRKGTISPNLATGLTSLATDASSEVGVLRAAQQ